MSWVCHSLYFPSRTLTPFVLHLAGHFSSVQNSQKKFGPFLKVFEMWSYLKHPWACLVYAKWFCTAEILLQFIFKYFLKKNSFHSAVLFRYSRPIIHWTSTGSLVILLSMSFPSHFLCDFLKLAFVVMGWFF